MKFVDPALEDYSIAHSDPLPPVYEALTEETWRDQELARMQVGPMEGRLLKMLVRISGARRAIEIGTFTGYSALSIAEGLPDDGTLLACDINPDTSAVAQKYWDQSDWGHKITLQLGPALDTIAAHDGGFDFAFVDADKENYIAYFEALIPNMPSGGLIVADNVLWSGRVLNPESSSDHGLADFNDHVLADDRVERVMLPIRDGITVIRKR